MSDAGEVDKYKSSTAPSMKGELEAPNGTICLKFSVRALEG